MGIAKNIAFKCNYCDGGKNENGIGFRAVCSRSNMLSNIDLKTGNWCGDEKSPCRQYCCNEITSEEFEKIMRERNKDLVCFESNLLNEWMAVSNMGIRQTSKNKLCVLVTSFSRDNRKYLSIFALFIIDEFYEQSKYTQGGYVKCNSKYKMILSEKERKAFLIRDYIDTEWGRGLTHYFEDDDAIRLLQDLVKSRSGKSNQKEAQEILDKFRELNGYKVTIDNTVERLEAEIDSLTLEGEDREIVIKQRVNQGVFRDRLLERYDQCCLCNIVNRDLLVASHIKPWSECAPAEKLDVDNGFLMCPNHDKIFDKGYISFDDNGLIMISSEVSREEQTILNISKMTRIELSEGNRRYLKYHREKIFREREKN